MNRENPKERIAVAMSGGVDSSVAALLLAQQGYNVVSFFLRNGVTREGPGSAKSCCSASDAADARRVADRLGIPFYALDVAEPFSRIISDFVSEYRRGRTPNPCVQCNVDVKFGHLLRLAHSVGASRVATGHYARVRTSASRIVLSRSADVAKDQSYVLATLRQEQLSRAMFPLGHLQKEQTRELAREAGLITAGKAESQEICFVPTGNYRDLLDERTQGHERPGEFVTPEGQPLGRHEGLSRYTVGQRRGLRMASGERQHVVRLEPDTNRVVIGSREQACAREFDLVGANWVAEPEPADDQARPVVARIRHRHPGAPGRAWRSGTGQVSVRFDQPEFAVTPGQTAVLYVGDDVLVAGTIERVKQEGRV